MADEEEPRVVRRTTNYGSNSHKARDEAAEPEERRKLEKVVAGAATKRKVPLGRRLVETFAGDSVHNVRQFILADVIVPAIKTMLSDAVTQGFERLLFGGTARNRPTGAGYRPRQNHTSYQNIFNGNNQMGRGSSREISTRASATHNFDEVILDSREEANDVLEALEEAIKEYGTVTVADLYDLVGITGNWADGQWGWTELRDAEVRLIRGGKYVINLPSTEPIN